MLQANGLYGHIQRNALKSALLLTGFVALTVLFWYAWCIVYTAIFDATLLNRIARRHRTVVTVYDYLGRAADRAVSLWWVPLVLSGIWFAIAYATHAALIRVATGARPITRREQPRLYNMVETLSITAGLPMPRVEIMPTDAMNAYASGLNPDDAVVAVSSGLLDALNDDELSAVIAHELTHIKNYDVRFMVVATVFAGGLTLLGNAVAKLWSGSSSPTATEGAAYGDDWQMSTNYPLVRLTSGGGTVYYARTFNWSSTGVA
ncbi:MAG: M48 family metalloprotease, partial [Hyphomicrobiaceae bacterium]|nr:M48 family metalloprotease [Hyphomicrobiaceae bacterium]